MGILVKNMTDYRKLILLNTMQKADVINCFYLKIQGAGLKSEKRFRNVAQKLKTIL